MSLNRRDFLKLCSGAAAGLGLSQAMSPALLSAMEEAAAKHPVIWIQGNGCTGCSVSLLNAVEPDIKKVLLDIISLEFHPTIMASEGETALENMYRIAEKFEGKFSLAVEGAIPRAANGKYCVVGELHHKELTMIDVVKDLGAKAGSVLSIGTCAAYGGIPAAAGSITDCAGVSTILGDAGIKTPNVNIPGCPPHPDWIVGSLAYLLTQGVPELDGDGRPVLFYGENLHENCPYVDFYDEEKYCKTLTDKDGCRVKLGCKGPSAYCDSYKRKWNNEMNWCIDNSVCIGCTEPGFPDEMSPFYVSAE